MPLIMIGQNIQGKHAQLRAQYDYETDRKAEKEIETILKKPLSEQTAEDRKKWAKWVAQEEKPKKQTETSPDLKPEAVKATNDETNQSAPSQS